MDAWDAWMMLTFTCSFTHPPFNAGSLIPCSSTRGKVWGGDRAHNEVIHVRSKKTGVMMTRNLASTHCQIRDLPYGQGL